MYNECRHILTRGVKCSSPALTGKSFCYYHADRRRNATPRVAVRKPDSAVLPLPDLEDATAIQVSISQVIAALAANRIDARRAGLLLYGLQVAAANLRNVRNLLSPRTVRDVCRQRDGSLLGEIIPVDDDEDYDDEEDEEEEESSDQPGDDESDEDGEDEDEEDDDQDEDDAQEDEDEDEQDGGGPSTRAAAAAAPLPRTVDPTRMTHNQKLKYVIDACTAPPRPGVPQVSARTLSGILDTVLGYDPGPGLDTVPSPQAA